MNLATALASVRRAERFLDPFSNYIEPVRGSAWRAADRPLRAAISRPTIREKGTDDYVTTVDADHQTVRRALLTTYQWNILSTFKYRTVGERRDWEVGTFVYDPANTDWQHHVYTFRAPDGRTDVYAHREPSVRSPKEHEGARQIHGDPNGRVRMLLDDANLDHQSREL